MENLMTDYPYKHSYHCERLMFVTVQAQNSEILARHVDGTAHGLFIFGRRCNVKSKATEFTAKKRLDNVPNYRLTMSLMIDWRCP